MQLKDLSDLHGKNYLNIIDLLNQKFNELKTKISELDSANNIIRSSLETWTYILKCNVQTVNNDYGETKKKNNKFNFIECIENEKLLESLTPQLNNPNVTPKTVLSNTWIIMLHSFIYLMNSLIIYPTNYLILERIGYQSYITGLVLAMTPLSSFLILPLFINNISFRYYKMAIFFAVLTLIFSNLLYVYSYFFKSLFLMILSRLLLGLGGLRILTNRYITEELPSHLILFYSKVDFITVWLGHSCGT